MQNYYKKSIIERFMDEEEFEEFDANYQRVKNYTANNFAELNRTKFSKEFNCEVRKVRPDDFDLEMLKRQTQIVDILERLVDSLNKPLSWPKT